MRKFSVIMLALLLALSAVCGCGCSDNGGKTPDETTAPEATPSTENPDGTEIPEWLWTLDPADFELREDGYYEDEYLTVTWPKEFSLVGTSTNSAEYCYRNENGYKVVLTYLIDSGGVFNDEIAGYDFNTYADYLKNELNSYFTLQEFDYIMVDGHPAARSHFIYEPPSDPDKTTHVIQYNINVKGWILSIGFSSHEPIPASCDESINTIRFKPGY